MCIILSLIFSFLLFSPKIEYILTVFFLSVERASAAKLIQCNLQQQKSARELERKCAGTKIPANYPLLRDRNIFIYTYIDTYIRNMYLRYEELYRRPWYFLSKLISFLPSIFSNFKVVTFEFLCINIMLLCGLEGLGNILCVQVLAQLQNGK